MAEQTDSDTALLRLMDRARRRALRREWARVYPAGKITRYAGVTFRARTAPGVASVRYRTDEAIRALQAMPSGACPSGLEAARAA